MNRFLIFLLAFVGFQFAVFAAPVLPAASSGGGFTQVALAASSTRTAWQESLQVTGASTITLPTAVGNGGKEDLICKADAGTGVVTVAAFGAQTLNGSVSPYTISSQFQCVRFLSDGANVTATIQANGVLSESGEVLPTGSFSPVGNIETDLTSGSFTLPSAGVFEVHYDMHATSSAAGNYIGFLIADSANAVVSNSQAGGFIATANVTVATYSQTVRITTTGAATYKLRAFSQTANAATIVQGGTSVGGNAYGSRLTWTKISGLTPISGQMADFMYGYNAATYSTNINSTDHIKFDSVRSSSGNILLDTSTAYTSAANVASIGRITLKAGKQYKLGGTINNADITTYGAVQWFNSDTNTAIGLVSTQASPDAGSNRVSSGWAVAYILPTVDTRVELRIVFEAIVSVNGTGDAIGPAQFTVDQIGTSAVSSFQGATSSTAGSAGFVPGPAAGDQTKTLRGDGTWSSGKLVLRATGTLTGTLGGVTFTINAGDPWNLTTSVAMTGRTSANILQYGNGAVWDYWTTGASGTSGLLVRGNNWNAATSGRIGLVSAAYSSTADGILVGNGNTYRIHAESWGSDGICVIEQIN